jgi:hypothetical protein
MVGDMGVWHIVDRTIWTQVLVNLKDRLDRVSSGKICKDLGQTAFSITIVHDRYARTNRLQDDRVVELADVFFH